MKSPENSPYPKDKDQLLRDFTVAGRLKDIRDAIQLQEQLAPKWWEALIGLIQFVAALGFLAALFLRFPPDQTQPTDRLIVIWMTLLILSLVFGFEFVIYRLHHLRRANQIALRMLEHLREQMAELEGKTSAMPTIPNQAEPKRETPHD